MKFRSFLASCALCLSAASLLAAEPTAESRAAYNAAIETLRRGDDERFEAAVSNFRVQSKDESLVGDLRLEAALFRAGQAWKSGRAADLEAAAQALRDFVRENSRHVRVAEARLALAELAAFSSEQDLDTARNQLRLARAADPSPVVEERCDVFAIQLAGRPGSADDPVALADGFLKRYPQSSFADSVRFVRAEELLERGALEDSGAGFERLADERPDSPLVPGALFGAGHAALRQQSGSALERSSTLFESAAGVAQDDRLRAAAQLGGARARLRLGRPAVALLQSDTLLTDAGNSPDPARVAATLTRGEALLRLSIDDPTLLSEAASAFRAVTSAKDVAPEWRRQAFAQLGDALRRSGDLTAAIAAWREALRTPPAKGEDTIWFARAGFDAAQALQELKLWREAAAVYEQIGQAGGLLRTEADARLTQLRLAHFLWPR
jgi:tetratricopeptide (TPR) repeat protein